MNIFSLLVSLVIGGTVIGTVFLLGKRPILIKIIRKNEEEPKAQITQPSTANTRTTEELTTPKVVAMDEVIKAANQLMGIEVLEKEAPHGAREE